MKKTAIAAALLLVSGAANAVAIDSLVITGGSFSMAGASGTINPAAFADMTVGGYDGSAPASTGTEAEYATTSIATFQFGGFGPVAVYTSETDGVNSGFAPVTGDLTGTDLSLDLSSWTAYWNGNSFNQGGMINTTVDGSGNFTATWLAPVNGGPFDGQNGDWTVTGTVSAVPVPAAVWLFGSGLVGLAGIARRRKAA